jgi:hypothetical protein
VRYLGTLLEDPLAVPQQVLEILAKQLRIEARDEANEYSSGEQRSQRANEIRAVYGYIDSSEPFIAFPLTRWLYALCWTGTDRPSVLFFERAATWLHLTVSEFVGESYFYFIFRIDGGSATSKRTARTRAWSGHRRGNFIGSGG